MRQQYHFRKIQDKIHIWDVNKLLGVVKNYPVRRIDIEKFETEINSDYWTRNEQLSCLQIAEHSKLILEADLTYPILVDFDLKLIDGMHRLCKAFLNNKKFIKTIVLEKMPPPDFIDLKPHELKY